MKKWEFIIGVDVSKNTLDFYCGKSKEHIRVINGSEGFKALLKWCKSLQIQLSNTIFVLEYTGGYEYKFLQFCQSKHISFSRLPGLEIKNSMGMVRGKTDLVDAQRIAKYGEEKHQTLTASKPLNTSIITLKELLSFRKRLVRENAGYKATLKERKHIYPDKKADIIIKAIEKKVKENLKHLKLVEKELTDMLNADTALFNNFILLTSIKGIGKINALMTIAYTENFTSFTDPRKYAVYSGVVPFDHSSGISIRARKRVSHLANKEIKQELNQAAKSAIAWNQDIKTYAERKLENKCYNIVLNNVKFKLIQRMFAVVKNQRMYVDNYLMAS